MVLIGIFPLDEECLLLLIGKKTEVITVKCECVVVSDLFAIFQCDQLGVRVAITSVAPTGLILVVLVFMILVFLCCCLLDTTGVFVGIMSIWVLPEDFLL